MPFGSQPQLKIPQKIFKKNSLSAPTICFKTPHLFMHIIWLSLTLSNIKKRVQKLLPPHFVGGGKAPSCSNDARGETSGATQWPHDKSTCCQRERVISLQLRRQLVTPTCLPHLYWYGKWCQLSSALFERFVPSQLSQISFRKVILKKTYYSQNSTPLKFECSFPTELQNFIQ